MSKVPPIKVVYDIGIQKHDLEGRTVTAEFKDFVLVACYVPNAGSGLARLPYRTTEWDPDFTAYLQRTRSATKKPIVLCGDLNCAHKEIDISYPQAHATSPGFTKEERERFSQMLESQRLIDTFRELYPTQVKYTYWDMRSRAREKNSGWRLDYFLISEGLRAALVDSEIMDHYHGSDHCPVRLTLTAEL